MNALIKTSKSGLALPLIGLGTWGIGGRSRERDPSYEGSKDIAAIRHALAKGINHIDTAEIYAGGHAEILVGEAIKGMERLDYTVASKVTPENHSQANVIKSCAASLKRLGLEYIDLYYLHAPSEDIPFKETATALKALRAEGVIRHYGICNYDIEQMKRIQDLLDMPIAVNQSKYSLVYRGAQTSGLLEHCQKTGTIFAAWRPLLWRYPGKEDQPAGNAWDKGIYPIMDEMSEALGRTNTQIALSWLIAQPAVMTLVKSSTISNIDEIAEARNWIMPESAAQRLTLEFPDQR